MLSFIYHLSSYNLRTEEDEDNPWLWQLSINLVYDVSACQLHLTSVTRGKIKCQLCAHMESNAWSNIDYKINLDLEIVRSIVLVLNLQKKKN